MAYTVIEIKTWQAMVLPQVTWNQQSTRQTQFPHLMRIASPPRRAKGKEPRRPGHRRSIATSSTWSVMATMPFAMDRRAQPELGSESG